MNFLQYLMFRSFSPMVSFHIYIDVRIFQVSFFLPNLIVWISILDQHCLINRWVEQHEAKVSLNAWHYSLKGIIHWFQSIFNHANAWGLYFMVVTGSLDIQSNPILVSKPFLLLAKSSNLTSDCWWQWKSLKLTCV